MSPENPRVPPPEVGLGGSGSEELAIRSATSQKPSPGERRTRGGSSPGSPARGFEVSAGEPVVRHEPESLPRIPANRLAFGKLSTRTSTPLASRVRVREARFVPGSGRRSPPKMADLDHRTAQDGSFQNFPYEGIRLEFADSAVRGVRISLLCPWLCRFAGRPPPA